MSIDLAFSFLSALGVPDDLRITTDGRVTLVSGARFQMEPLGHKHPKGQVKVVESRMRFEVRKRVSK